jgi:hypothetical protein
MGTDDRQREAWTDASDRHQELEEGELLGLAETEQGLLVVADQVMDE